MRRRDFIAGLGGAAVVGPRGAWAQQAGKLPTIGYLGASTRLILNQRREAFVQGLRELGWVEGRNVIIEYRWAEGRDERYAEIAAEFVRLKVDVIVVSATAPVMAAKRATSVIPIVFAISADPVGTGLVASLSRPGGNVTGLSIQTTDIARKRLEFLREVVPKFGRLAILTDVSSGGSVLDKEEARAAAATLGLDVIALDIRRAEDITPVFETLKGGADALYVCAGPRTFGNVTRINTLALGARLPTMHANREFVEAGGLMSYGPNILDQYRRAADYVDKILRGAKPTDLPVQQPTKFELVFNRTTAKALGIEIPSRLLFTADEIIE